MKRIYINGKSIYTERNELTYEDVVNMCECRRSRDALHTIVWSNPVSRRSGSLIPGQSVSIVHGFIISAAVTDGA